MVAPAAHVEVVAARPFPFDEAAGLDDAGLDETEAEADADAEAVAEADKPSRERSACPSLRPSTRGEASAPAPESAESAERSVPPSAATDESGRGG